MRPKILLSTAPWFRRPLREAFHHAREAGYEAVEVMVTQDPATQDGDTISALAEQFGLRVEALHAPFLLVTRRIWGTEPVEKIYRATQVATQAGIPLVVVHPPYKWQTRYRQWIARSLIEYSAHTGVIIGVENMFPIKLPGERGIRFHARQQLEELDHYPTLVLDTSHLAVSGFDPLEVYERYRTKVVHFHVSNNAGKGWDSHLSVDEGVLSLDTLLTRIGENGFGGTVALELDLRRYIGDDAAVTEVLIRNREFCEEHLGVRA